MGAALEAQGHRVTLAEGGKSKMRAIADADKPDVMLVDGMCCDPDELTHVEQVTNTHPGTAVILLCAAQTPEFLINSMRAGVREVLPSPAPAVMLQSAVARIAAKFASTRGNTKGKIVALLPCKGGSGATFLATNLGYQLAESRSVLLIDLNLQFGDALSFVHDGKPPSTIADVAREITRLDASLLASSTVKVTPNFSILAAPEDLAQAMEVRPDHVEAILNVAVTQYDFVLLDLGLNLDPIAIKALDRAQRIYVVMQSELPSVRNAGRLLQVFRSLGYPQDKTEVILNRYERNSDIGLDQIRKSLGQVRVVTVANSYKEVHTAINHGEALAKAAKSNTVARQLAELATALDPRQEDGSKGLLDRLFRRA
ncbi:AAA family ATPase [Ramlibacter solisilvae]|nr:AAA family ATPase [Ramlibacter tataouinensis]